MRERGYYRAMNQQETDEILAMARRAKDDAAFVEKHPDSNKTRRLAEAVVTLATAVETLIESTRPTP
jgi:hypothetical protein